MKHPTSLGHRLLRWVGAVLAVLVLLAAVFTAWNWKYVQPVLQGLGVLPTQAAQEDEWSALEQEVEQDFASSAAGSDGENGPEEPQSPALTPSASPELPEASEAPAESATPEESAAASETPAATQTPTASASPTATPTASASPSATPAATPSQSPEASASPEETDAEPDYEAEVQACVAEMKAMENKFEKRLYGIIKEALDEYLALPEGSRNLVKKVTIVLSKKSALEAMEKECDAEVDEILTRMRAALAASGQDDTLAREAERAYKKKKSDTIAELTKLAYSGGNGESTTQQWFWDHGV